MYSTSSLFSKQITYYVVTHIPTTRIRTGEICCIVQQQELVTKSFNISKSNTCRQQIIIKCTVTRGSSVGAGFVVQFLFFSQTTGLVVQRLNLHLYMLFLCLLQVHFNNLATYHCREARLCATQQHKNSCPKSWLLFGVIDKVVSFIC